MKKFWKSMMFALLSVFAMSSCEDVPAPYPTPGTGGSSTEVELTGEGTFENPYTVADALALIKANKYTDQNVYVKGIITAVGIEKDGEMTDLPGSTYGNATYFISDVDETGAATGTALEVFRGKGLDGEAMSTADYIKVGDDVIVCGVLTKYGSTPEVATGSKLMKLNDQIVTPKETGTPAGSGTAEDPYNVAAANQLIDGLQETTDSKNPFASDEVYVKGVITKIETSGNNAFNPQYGNMTYYIADVTEDGSTTVELEVYRGLYLGGEKFTAADQIKVGDAVTVVGKLVNFKGTYEFTTGNSLYELNGEKAPEKPDTPSGEAKGDGTEANPYNVAAANVLIDGLQETTDSKNPYASDDVYVKGIITKIETTGSNAFNPQYGNMTYWIADKNEAGEVVGNELEIYRGYYLNGERFTSGDQIQVGQEVVIVGKLVNFKGTYEFTSGSKLVSIDGEGAPDTPDTPDTPDNPNTDPVAGISVTSSQIVSGASGSVSLGTNAYGSQAVATESTWYKFVVDEVSFTGCRICIASDSNGGGIQMQGNASDTSKQGFITNVTPFTPIKTITVNAHIASGGTYDPSFHLYTGTATHPTGNAITGNMTKDGNNYTFVFDLSTGDYTFFTIANDLQGVLYIDSFTVETK